MGMFRKIGWQVFLGGTWLAFLYFAVNNITHPVGIFFSMCFIFLYGFLIVYYEIFDYFCAYEVDNRWMKMNFRQFKKFYGIAPKKFKFDDIYSTVFNRLYFYGEGGYTQIRFGFFSFVAFFVYWHCFRNNNKYNEGNIEATQDFISTMQKEVDKLNTKASIEIKKAKDINNLIGSAEKWGKK